MSLFSKFFGVKYNDGEIVSHVQSAISSDPIFTDSAGLSVSSEKGVVTIKGSVPKRQEKDRLEGVVRSVLRDSGLKHERIVNDLVVH